MRRFDIPQLNKTMEKYGWLITGVPGLAIYTVGLTDKFDHPELAIHGLEARQAGFILHSAVDLVAEGLKMADGGKYGGIIRNYESKALLVDPSNYLDWFGQGYDYYEHELRMLQLLWPDPNGKFPGDRQYDKVDFPQLRFDVRRPEYGEGVQHGETCVRCKEEI